MATPQDHISMALFCDFENVALGVRDANYEKFDIKRVLERLLLKGSIVVKKAYCDWERYKGFKAAMHEANFELIEIPHVRQSGKNSADIRLVVDALDLCYTKSHVNTFVIISGDSDFSPLVSKLRENAKYVIGVGVKQSTSDLLIANCDEFIFYDDLVRDSQRQRRDNRDQPQQRRSPEEEARRRAEMDARRTKAVEMAAETYEALVTDRDDGGRIWASVLKEAIKRRNPGFNENYYGFRTFGNLLEEARQRGLLEFGRDEKSGAYVYRSGARGEMGAAALEAVIGAPVPDAMDSDAVMPMPSMAALPFISDEQADSDAQDQAEPSASPAPAAKGAARGRGSRGSRARGDGKAAADRKKASEAAEAANDTMAPASSSEGARAPASRGAQARAKAVPASAPEAQAQAPASAEPDNQGQATPVPAKKTPARRGSGGRARKTPAKKTAPSA